MTLEIAVSALGVIIGVVGLLVGFIQNRQKIRFEKIVRANNWFNFQKSYNASGTLQDAIKLYRQEHSESINAEVLALFEKADAFSQEVYKESIRQIHFTEPSFSKSDIEAWLKSGRINELDKRFFSRLTEASGDGA